MTLRRLGGCGGARPVAVRSLPPSGDCPYAAAPIAEMAQTALEWEKAHAR